MTYPPPPSQDDDGGERPPAPMPPPSSYPTPADGLPTYPRGAANAPTPVEQPPAIVRAVMLMRLGSALSLVSILVSVLTRDTVKDNIRQRMVDNGDFTQSSFDTAYRVFVISAILGGIIATGLWLWMAQANGAGRKWARIVATVFGGLSIVGFVTTVGRGENTAIGTTLAALTAVLAVVILTLLWSREATTFYEARSRRPVE